MNAILATGYGSPEVLEFQSVAKPVAKNSEVLVKVYATAVTRADAMMRTGKPYAARLMLGLTKPKNGTPGTGFAGVVEAVGSEVENFQIGDRVFGETAMDFRANAEFLVIPENGVVLKMNDNMTFSFSPSESYMRLKSTSWPERMQALASPQPVFP